MSPVSTLGKTPLWRPFLDVPKTDIWHFLKSRGLEPFLDPTNEDPKFLRARLRGETLPWLERSFGKGIISNLQVLSERSLELQSYLDHKIAAFQRAEGPWGIFLDLTNVHRIEARHALQAVAREKGMGLPREILESWLNALESGDGFRYGDFCADRGRAFFLARKRPQFEGSVALKEGTFVAGDWTLEVRAVEQVSQAPAWRDVWSGGFEAVLPDGTLQLPFDNKCHEMWRKTRVPVFLRKDVPLLITDNQQLEFLSGLNVQRFIPRWGIRFSIF
jgi:tRNA(Ile)-lysidine synthase